ncbi:hypothetical protein GQ457_09G000910 [Hibiscus cannabinus]
MYIHILDAFNEVVWRCTGFYGAPEVANRVHSWNLLRSLNDCPDIPWLVFRDALNDCALADVGFSGVWYTWEKGRMAVNNIRERLDRGVANSTWWELFPNFRLSHLEHSFSDHCPLLMELDSSLPGIRRRWHFRFEASWLLEDTCEAEVKRLWAASSGPIPDRLVMLELADLYPTDEVLHETIDVKLALNLEIDREELYWEQRARANWLKNGDQNSAFFHQGNFSPKRRRLFATQRRRQNRVSGLDNGSGQRVEDPGDMAAVAMQYFRALFLSQAPTEWDQVLSGLSPCITPVMNESLTRPFTMDEVLSAVKAMSPLKAVGADGLGAVFYQRFWGIVGQEVGRYCIELLGGLHSFSDINHTHIVLIPKLSSPVIDVSEISPIIENAKALVSRFACCQFRFTHRIANRTAHAMAKEGRGMLQDRFWVEEAPSAVSDLAAADRRLLEPP